MFTLPKEIMLELTDRCNLNCEYCFRSSSKSKGTFIKWDDFTTIVQKLPFVEVFALCGMGEQLIYPQFYEVVEYLAIYQKKVAVITNGTVKINYERLLKSGNVESVTFSVDGADEEVIRRVCSQYDFNKLQDNLITGMEYPQISKEINCVMTESNIEDVINIVGLCSKFGISKLNMLLPTYSTDWVKENSVQIKNILNMIQEEAKEKKIIYSSPYEKYCFYKGAPIPFVSLSGNIRACCDHYNRIPRIGNLVTNEFKELFESKRYSRFNSGEYCKTCSMYSSMVNE
ncbi:radical SAM protein [Ruminiclostridium herbifermentans]|uniref:Radical SAM protein n=1 Tax=Ruminiclostridium herbifermentans TaxID=2488810 RepID=A0A4U7JJH8_9FIRM|nr:radical SAM protein [Ruminiclostridium herbifermentans]QNU66080.1 radical SAM protein [Ruminiclostridium herbifermentans]